MQGTSEKENLGVRLQTAKRIMKISVRSINDLIGFWYLSDIFRTVLSTMEWSSGIWLEAIKETNVYSHDFSPLGEALLYLYEKEYIDEEKLISFIILDVPNYSVSKFLLDSINFDLRTLLEILQGYIYLKDYVKASIIFNSTNSSKLIKRISRNEYEDDSDEELDCFWLDYGSNSDNILQTALFDGQLDFISLLIERGYPVNCIDANHFLRIFSLGLIPKEIFLGVIQMFVDIGINLENLDLSSLFLSNPKDSALSELLSMLGHLLDPTKKFIHTRRQDYRTVESTILDLICIQCRLRDLLVLIDYGIDISDPSLSSFFSKIEYPTIDNDFKVYFVNSGKEFPVYNSYREFPVYNSYREFMMAYPEENTEEIIRLFLEAQIKYR
jgi:hypothetical protein